MNADCLPFRRGRNSITCRLPCLILREYHHLDRPVGWQNTVIIVVAKVFMFMNYKSSFSWWTSHFCELKSSSFDQTQVFDGETSMFCWFALSANPDYPHTIGFPSLIPTLRKWMVKPAFPMVKSIVQTGVSWHWVDGRQSIFILILVPMMWGFPPGHRMTIITIILVNWLPLHES